MAATSYTYDITDTANDAVDCGCLFGEIEAASGIDPTCIDVGYIAADTNIVIWFDAALTGGEEDTLDAVIAAHQGTAENCECVVSTQLLLPGSYAVTSDSAWETIVGFSLKISDFEYCDASKLYLHFWGESDIVGDIPQLRLVKDKGSVIAISDTLDLSVGNDVDWELDSNQTLSTLRTRYGLQGRLNSGTSCAIHHVSMSLMETR